MMVEILEAKVIFVKLASHHRQNPLNMFIEIYSIALLTIFMTAFI